MIRVSGELFAFYVKGEGDNHYHDFARDWNDDVLIIVDGKHFDGDCRHLEAWCAEHGFKYQMQKIECDFLFD